MENISRYVTMLCGIDLRCARETTTSFHSDWRLVLSSGTYGTLTNLSSLKGDNDVSLFLGQLQLVGLSKVLGLVGIRALDAGRRKDCREQAGERQGGVTTGQVASLLESVGGVTGDGVDASLSVDDGI